MMAKKKERLDKLLVDRGLAPSRSRGQALIMAGDVQVDGERVDKPGTAVAVTATIEVRAPMPFVSRGGYKLAGALAAFDLAVTGRTCADVGACTGGFTDVLLQQGAAHVFAIDVGYGQLDWRLRQDPRVTVLERTNARYLTALPAPITLAVIDVAFISLKLILPVVSGWFAPDVPGDVVALIKPQFEAGRAQVGKGGVVRDPAVHQAVLLDMLGWMQVNDFAPLALTRSSIAGADGNVEFLVHCRRQGGPGLDITMAVAQVVPDSG